MLKKIWNRFKLPPTIIISRK